MKFYDREEEMKILSDLPDGFNLVVIYGRRRIGKTRLVREFLSSRRSAYIFIPSGTGKGRFLEDVSDFLNIPVFNSISDMFAYVLDKYDHVFIDEFQNLRELEKGSISLMQRTIDILDHGGFNKTLIVAGSSHSMMRSIFLEEGRPLFGRATRSMMIRDLPVSSCFEIMKDIGVVKKKEFIEYYSVFGGVPKYYSDIDTSMGSRENIRRLFLDSSSPYRNEGSFLVKSELGGEYRVYMSILDAISTGHHSLKEIGAAIASTGTTTSRYVKTLRDEFELIRRDFPVSEDPRKYKKSRYVMKDNLIEFWFRFVKSMEPYLEQGMDSIVRNRFNDQFPHYVSSVFEKVCRKIVTGMGYSTSAWWKKDEEMDILGIDHDSGSVIFGEVKWRERKTGMNTLVDLKRKSELITGLEGYDRKYIIISRNGFTERLKDIDEKNVLLWDLDDVISKIETLGI